MTSPAKLNLVLDVLGRRSDGYHDIRSLVAPVSLCDEVRINRTVTAGIATVVKPVALPNAAAVAAALAGPGNLATRAAELFYARAGLSGGCSIAVRKRIPIGAGLGGGSADAAAVLVGLNVLCGRPFRLDILADMGAEIGCDVPALVWGRPVWVAGRGERLEPLSKAVATGNRPLWMVLLNPGFAVSTADIYRRWNPGLTSGRQTYKNIESVLVAGDCRGLAGCLWNSLQAAAFKKYPALELLAAMLRAAGARGVMLAGSGGTVFGLAASRAEAYAVRRRAAGGLDSTVWSRVVKTMPDGVMVAHGPLEARV